MRKRGLFLLGQSIGNTEVYDHLLMTTITHECERDILACVQASTFIMLWIFTGNIELGFFIPFIIVFI